MALTSTHAVIKAHTTVPISVFPFLSEPVEQFEVSHQAQLVWWQDLLEWNCLDAEQEPKHFLVKGNVNQTHVARRQGRNETRLIHTAASLWYYSEHFGAKWSLASQSAGDGENGNENLLVVKCEGTQAVTFISNTTIVFNQAHVMQCQWSNTISRYGQRAQMKRYCYTIFTSSIHLLSRPSTH